MSTRNLDDTICALATPPGFGGISVIRVSGKNALPVVAKLVNLPGELSTHRVYFLNVYDHNKKEILDEALISYYEEGKSYTDEHTFEISCHGSPIVVEKIIQNLILAGARSAERGEFTFRSFMAGKIDLIQAEGILSLIESESQKAHEVSLKHLKGDLSEKIASIRDKITWILAHLEASIDFSLEDLKTIETKDVENRIKEIKESVDSLLDSYEKGKVLEENLKVSIVGSPNAGKSSLFNQFLKQDKAIVTEIAGTTRDVLEGEMILSGVKVKIYDTAGVHETNDRIENMGIQKTKEQIEKSDYIFYVLDKTQKPLIDEKLIQNKNAKNIFFLANKSDLNKSANYKEDLLRETEKIPFAKSTKDFQYFEVSALTAETLLQPMRFLEQKLQETFLETTSIVLKSRQYDLLLKSQECLERAFDLASKESSSEFTAFELRQTLEYIFELLGERLDDNVLDKVFQEFCIGK